MFRPSGARAGAPSRLRSGARRGVVSLSHMNSPACLPYGELLRQLGRRLRARWVTKLVGLSVGMTAFFVVYFRLLHHPAFPVTIMPLTALDRLVGFHPGALPLYVSLWIYVPLAFALLGHRRDLAAHGVASVVLSAIGLGLFWRWPTAVPPLAHDWSALPWFSFLKSVDAAGNACPSLHVAFAVLTAIGLARLLRTMRAPRSVRAGNGLWCLGIVYSTLATGQHVALDALAGAVLGVLVGLPLFFLRPATDDAGRVR